MPAAEALSSLVSIVVPCYRQAHFLRSALASISLQTHRLLDVIVVDDGSPDDVASVVHGHAGVRLVRQENRGLPAARNAGLAVARGDFVVFLDADDVLYANGIAAGMEALTTHPAASFAAGGYTMRVGGVLRRNPAEHTGEPAYERMLRSNFVGMHGAVLFRRTALVAVGGFREDLTSCEDFDLYLRMLRFGDLVLHDTIVAEYRRHDSNMSDDAARMLVGYMSALRAQWPHVRHHPALRAAYEAGLRRGRESYGEVLAAQGRRALAGEGFDLWRAARAFALLLRYYPGHFVARALRLAARRAGLALSRGARHSSGAAPDQSVPAPHRIEARRNATARADARAVAPTATVRRVAATAVPRAAALPLAARLSPPPKATESA